MAAPRDLLSLAWCLFINQTPTPIYAATTDLPEDAAIATLGAFYTKRIKRVDSVLTQTLPNLFYGVTAPDTVTFTLDNVDNALDQSLDWRQVPVTLYRYDRNGGTITTGLAAKAATVQSIGVSSITAHTAVSTGACALIAGDEIAIAGQSQIYVLTAAATQATANSDVTLAITPPLVVALAGGEAITVPSTLTTDLVGLISQATFQNTEATLALTSYDPSLFTQLLPTTVIQAQIGSPFAFTSTPNVPVPVVFGGPAPIQAPSATDANVNPQFNPNGTVASPNPDRNTDLIAGYGKLIIQAVFADIDLSQSGLEEENDWAPAAGSPVYVSTTAFSVTGDQSQRYAAPIGGTITTGLAAKAATVQASGLASIIATTAPGTGACALDLGARLSINSLLGSITTGLTAKAATVQSIGTSPIVAHTAPSTGACALLTGAVIAIAGQTQTYTLTAPATQASANTNVNLPITPPLQVALAGGEAITLVMAATRYYSLTAPATQASANSNVTLAISPPLVDPLSGGEGITLQPGSGYRVRFRTTASGTGFLYSNITKYDTAPTPHQVIIADPILDSGLNSVGVNGDTAVVPYSNVTAGLFPEPATGQDLTAVRLFNQANPVIIMAISRDFPPATLITNVVKEIITNNVWGLSTLGAQQTVNGASFAAAGAQLAAANLVGAVAGALAYDGNQRDAAGPVNELLMMRGIILSNDSALAWHVTVDTLPDLTAVTSFQLGPGDSSAIKIKKVMAHGRKSLDQAVRNVVLHWSPLGSGGVGIRRFMPRAYGCTTTAPASGIGQDLNIFSQWIRSKDIAERVAYYYGQKVKGADETLQILCGVEARDVVLGQVINVVVPSDQIGGDWQVYTIAKSLTEVTLSCIRLNTDAYTVWALGAAPPAGVVSNLASGISQPPIVGHFGTNEIPNPDFSPPAKTSSLYQVLPGIPHGWNFTAQKGTVAGVTGTILLDPTWFTGAMDTSALVLPQTIGGHYWRINIKTTVGMNAPAPAPNLTAVMGVFTDLFSPVRVNTADMIRIISFYCDQVDGVYLLVAEFDGSDVETKQLVPLLYLPTDTNALGWSRFYARWRPQPTTVQAYAAIGFSRAGTFLIEAAQCQRVGHFTTLPPPWTRSRQVPTTFFTAAEVTFNGSTNPYVLATLIPAGAYVLNVDGIITQTLAYGTAVAIDIGTDILPNGWVKGFTGTASGVDTTGNPGIFTNIIYFPTASNVVVYTVDAGDTPGATITSGKLRVQVEYTLGAPISSN